MIQSPVKIVAVYGSPRRKGNTALLTKQAVKGAEAAGAVVEEIVLRDLKISPCLEIYGCKNRGRCIIQDEFHPALERVLSADGLIISSPVFFYTVSAHMKIFMDRCQSLWVKKYWVEKNSHSDRADRQKSLFICAGATKGKKLFDGVLLTMRYFLDVLDARMWKSLLYRGLDHEGDVLAFPHYLQEAYDAGNELVRQVSRADTGEPVPETPLRSGENG